MWLSLLLAIVVAVLTVYATRKVDKQSKTKSRKARAAWASVAEEQAPALLKSQGFEVVGRQPTVSSWIEVNGKDIVFQVRADYMVKDRDGNLLVADVKTGKKAPNPKTIATRRQLLEYRMLYKMATGVLLVDMESKNVLLISFPDHQLVQE